MRPTVACIVEGHGDVAAVPVLLRRLAHARELFNLHIPEPVRCRRHGILKPGGEVDTAELTAAVELATRRLPGPRTGALLVVLDADEDCPAEAGAKLLAAVERVRPDVASAVVLARREFEAWFLAAGASLTPDCISRPEALPDDPESVSGAKERLRRCMGGRYSETVDQARLAARFDLQQAAACRSFRKFLDDVNRLLDHLSA